MYSDFITRACLVVSNGQPWALNPTGDFPYAQGIISHHGKSNCCYLKDKRKGIEGNMQKMNGLLPQERSSSWGTTERHRHRRRQTGQQAKWSRSWGSRITTNA
jgi:hypothetical protein